MPITVVPMLQAAASGAGQGAASRGWLDPMFLSFVGFVALQLVVFVRLLLPSRSREDG